MSTYMDMYLFSSLSPNSTSPLFENTVQISLGPDDTPTGSLGSTLFAKEITATLQFVQHTVLALSKLKK